LTLMALLYLSNVVSVLVRGQDSASGRFVVGRYRVWMTVQSYLESCTFLL